MSNRWPNKPVTKFTDAELATTIEQHEADHDPVTRSIVQSCTREWERRHGLNHLNNEHEEKQ